MKNCPILTKFGVHIVWSMLNLKIKKNFVKNYISDNFFSGAVHCARANTEILKFFSFLQKIYMLGISNKLGAPQGMFILLSKSENGGTYYTHVHCAETKNILAN